MVWGRGCNSVWENNIVERKLSVPYINEYKDDINKQIKACV